MRRVPPKPLQPARPRPRQRPRLGNVRRVPTGCTGRWHSRATGRPQPSQALPSDPDKPVFECALRAQPDADTPNPAPVWLHLHAKRPMTPEEALRAGPDDFDAVHLKSDTERNRGAQWSQAQAEAGLDAKVHRSRVLPHQLPLLLGVAVAD
jgi:hypothetical protein